jgi:uncharacterized protein (TIGR02246 family)
MKTEEQTLAGIVEAWAAAVRAHDTDGVLRHHASDLLMFDVVGPTQINGLDAYKASWVEQFFPWHGETGRFDLAGLKVHADTDVAFATALIHCAGTENGKRVAFTVRLTMGFVRRAGDWLIVHEHHSEPLPEPAAAA